MACSIIILCPLITQLTIFILDFSLSKSVETLQRMPSFNTKKLSEEFNKLNRKSSLPAVAFGNRSDKNWFKDQKWLKVPADYSTAEPHKIQQLHDWLQTVGKSQNVQDLEEMLDWKNNKPTSSKGKIIF